MKWNALSKLSGLTVMVSPGFIDDPARKNGKIGKVVSFFPEKQIITIRFSDRATAAYLPPQVLMLRSRKEILKTLTSPRITSGDNCKAILNVYWLIISK